MIVPIWVFAFSS